MVVERNILREILTFIVCPLEVEGYLKLVLRFQCAVQQIRVTCQFLYGGGGSLRGRKK